MDVILGKVDRYGLGNGLKLEYVVTMQRIVYLAWRIER